MDDLIKRLRESRAVWSNEGGKVHTCPSDLEAEAATALAEAQATIARQQALLDRALESNGDMMVTIARLEAALREIIDASNNTGIEMGTVGMRVAERVEDIASAALSPGKAELSNTPDTAE